MTEGEHVAREQRIATVGMTGRSTGYHLHFAVKGADGKFIEPVITLLEQDD